MASTHYILRELVARAKCKIGWTFCLDQDPNDTYPKLVITVSGYNSAKGEKKEPLIVRHYFPVPEATYNEKSWQRWMFEMCRRVENHELGEWFRIDEERPFAPLHGPGEDPYTVHEYREIKDALTTQDGSERKPYGEQI